MPKIKTPAPTKPATQTPEVEAPKAPDISPLMESIAPYITEYKEGADVQNNATVNIAVECRAFREENPEVERSAIKLALQTAIADAYGLKIEHVQNKPDDKLKNSKPADYAARNSAYVLVSTLLSIAWAKEEKQDNKVAKALKDGETRFVVLKKLASKPQSNPQRDPDANKITKENFAAKFALFVTQAMTDMGADQSTVLDMAAEAASAMESAPKE